MYIILCFPKTTEKSLEKKHILFLSNSDRIHLSIHGEHNKLCMYSFSHMFFLLCIQRYFKVILHHILFLSNSDRLVTNLARMCFYFRFRKKQIISSLLKHWVLNRPFNFRWVLFSLISFRFVFVDFVSFPFVFVDFVSFRFRWFRFALYRYPITYSVCTNNFQRGDFYFVGITI
jgi:hypothetical protein